MLSHWHQDYEISNRIVTAEILAQIDFKEWTQGLRADKQKGESNYLKDQELCKIITLDLSSNNWLVNFTDYLPAGIELYNPTATITCKCGIDASKGIMDIDEDEEQQNEFYGYSYYCCSNGKCDFIKLELDKEEDEDEDYSGVKESDEHAEDSDSFSTDENEESYLDEHELSFEMEIDLDENKLMQENCDFNLKSFFDNDNN
jgi:hypothetical protein